MNQLKLGSFSRNLKVNFDENQSRYTVRKDEEDLSEPEVTRDLTIMTE